MDQAHGGLKDIFSTILGETSGKPTAARPKIVVNGNGNVIAPGGTVHYVQAKEAARGSVKRTPKPQS